MEPHPDQWSLLSTVARLSTEAASEAAATLRPTDAGPAVSLAELARQGGPPPPPVIRGQLAGRLSLERVGVPPAVLAAFPLAFKSRGVQYVGRLLRTHADKHHVELHDYVDVRIPVLARMHTKRLPTYATLGFETPKRPRRLRPPAPPNSNIGDPF